MRRVFVCSPLRGNIEGNQHRARQFARFVALQGHVPVVPHIYFTQFLKEECEDERALGIEMGISLLSLCDAMWVFAAPSAISSGMAQEIEHWRAYHDTAQLRFIDPAEVL